MRARLCAPASCRSSSSRSVVGVLAGLGVAAMTELVDVAHVVIYGIPFDVRLSAAARVSPVAAFAALPLGGLAVGLIDHWRRARKLPRAVDPIEANALRGGPHVDRRKPGRVCANGDLQRQRRFGRARIRLRADRRRHRFASRAGAASAPSGPAPPGRLRRRRRDRSGVRRAAHRRLLRVGADHRRVFARQRRSDLRRRAGGDLDHQGAARRALRHRRAAGRGADPRRSFRAGGARPDFGGDRRRRDARRRAARTRLRRDARAALGASGARRRHAGGDGALHAAGSRRRTRRDRARLLRPRFPPRPWRRCWR